MKRIDSHRPGRVGATLIEVMVGLGLTALVVAGAVEFFGISGKMQKNAANDTAAKAELTNLDTFLTKRLGGHRGLQGLRFQVRSLQLSCFGSGLCVVPDQTDTGKKSASADLIVFVSRLEGPTLELAADYDGTGPLKLHAAGAAVPLAKDDVLAISDARHSDVIEVTSAVNVAAGGNVALAASRTSQRLTFPSGTAGQLLTTYRSGDAVYRVRLYRLALDDASREVRLRPLLGGTQNVVARGIDQLRAAYQLRDSATVCTQLSSPPDQFVRDGWGTLNIEPTHRCYGRLKAVQFSYTSGQMQRASVVPVNN